MLPSRYNFPLIGGKFSYFVEIEKAFRSNFPE